MKKNFSRDDRKRKRKQAGTAEDAVTNEDYSFITPDLFQLPTHLKSLSKVEKLKYRTTSRPSDASKIKIKEYYESKNEAVKLRKKILNLVRNENDANDFNDEKNLVRYYYYIDQGVDIVNIAPMDDRWIENILSRISDPLKSRRYIVDYTLTEVKEDFLFSIKKSAVDFTLQDNSNGVSCLETTPKYDLCEIRERRLQFERIRTKIAKNLFKIHPTIVKISQLWLTQYSIVRILNVEELKTSDALDLNSFRDWLSSQIQLCKSILLEKWIPSVFKIVLNVLEKKHFAEIKEKKLGKFYECLSTLMTLQLQTTYLNTICEYTEFLCDVTHGPGFQVHVLYKNNKIIFNPTYNDFKKTFLNVFSDITKAVNCIPRIETKMYVKNTENCETSGYLKLLLLPEVIDSFRDRVEAMLQDEWICPELKIQDFDQYICLINGQSRIEVNKFLSEDRPFRMFKEMVSYYHELGIEICLSCSRVVTLGMFEIHREHFVSILINKCQATKDRFLTKISDTYQDACKRLNEEFQEIKDTLLKPPLNTAELVRIKEYGLVLGTRIFFEMEDRLRETMTNILFCSDYVPLTSAQIKQNSITFLCYRRIHGILEENRNILKEKTNIFQELLIRRIEAFKSSLEKYRKEVNEFQSYRDAGELSKYLKKAQNLQKKFVAAKDRIKEFNEEEIAFGWMITYYPERDELIEQLSPYKKLYENCADYENKYQLWTEAKIGTFDPEEIENDVETFHCNIIELSRQFSSIPAPYALTNSIRLEVEHFQKHMPIVKTLGNPCLKERHWEKISEIVGFPLRVEEDLTLAKILDYGLEEYVPKFEVISNSATKESNLEKRLNQMIAEWKDMKFEITPYRDSGTYILTTTDDIQILLDDHIVKTQTMKNSPYIKPFETIIQSWEEKLILLQEIIDAWLLVQKTWLYLEPIFSFTEIQHLIPEEFKRFNAVDKVWKDIMKATSSNTSVLTVINIEKILERLAKCNTLLNTIQNGLTGFLETKRLAFPRFFFLSNEDILDIISNTRDATGVQPFLAKCFGGIKELRFTEDADIVCIVSDLQEELHLNEPVDTGIRRGQVEKWLADLERVMKNTIQQDIKKAFADYEKDFQSELTTSWTQQIICFVTNAVFTSNIEQILDDTNSLMECYADCCRRIEQMIVKLSSKLERRMRYTFASLVTHLIQARENLQALLSKSDGERRAEFQMHLRYYVKNDDIFLSMINSSIKYGFEYTGNFIPLIATPVTDRCYKSFFIAFKYGYGSIVEGPPGTGKTEIINNFAKLLARNCVIVNCSKNFNYNLVEKFVKGMLSSNSWLCLDNMELLQRDGMKIIEHFAIRVQQAIHFDEKKLKSGGINFNVEKNHLLFATMNPKYSRNLTNIAPFLKSVLRWVSFDDADFTKLLEVKFFISGFKNFRILAVKLNAVMKICSRIFEDHKYFKSDLRTQSLILKNAENLKSKYLKVEEEVIVSKAVLLTCRSSFQSHDWLLFKKILDHTFKNDYSKLSNESVLKVIRKACAANNFIFDEGMVERIRQLLQVIDHCPGIIIVGDALTGKSTVLKVLASTLKLLQVETSNETIEMVFINPKSVTYEQLYGHQDQKTGKWMDGILSSQYRKFSTAKNNKRKWLILDGPMDSSWIENLSTVLDDSRKLCLRSGGTIRLPKKMNIIFETADLNHVSPSMVSRCHVTYVGSEFLKWEYLISSWLHEFPPLIAIHQRNHIKDVALRYCRTLFHFIDQVFDKLIYSTTKNHMIKSLCNIFECFMDDFQQENYFQTNSEIDIRAQLEVYRFIDSNFEIEVMGTSNFQGIFFFSCIWSIGALLSKDDQQNFDTLFRALQSKHFPTHIQNQFQLPDELCEPPAKQCIYPIPDTGTVFDYQFVKEGKGKWKFWSDSLTETSAIPREIQFRQIIVPRRTTKRNQHLISLLISHQKLAMLVGDTASGKTVDIMHFLDTKLDKNLYKAVYFNFSVRTTANSIQNLINNKLDKRKKGVYGPPLGIRYVMFIDDLNAARPDQFGVTSATELIRHWIEYHQWYDLENSASVQLTDLQLVCALTTRNDEQKLCSRFSRHFNIIANDVFDDETLKSVFSKIMLWHLDTRGFSKEFDPCIEQIVNATLVIYRLVQRNLLPVPHKSHYIFNLRDFSRTIQGVVLSVPEAIEDLLAMKRLWVHEVMRIYHDRVIEANDSNWFMSTLKAVASTELKEDLNNLLQHLLAENEIEINQYRLRKLIFCDFINPKADIRNYAEVQDMDGLQSIIEGFLTEYNNVNKKPMHLLLFSYAIEHISRICRILKQPQGHALLLGECGCGKQSLARLAIHMCEYEFFEIDLTGAYNEDQWRDDMKNLLFSVFTDQHSAVLFSNIQTMHEAMLEDISSLLQIAEIPAMFTAEEKKEICEKMEAIDNQRDKSIQTDGSPEALLNFFFQRVKKQIHVVLVFSSSIYDFRKYINKFPSFINCCTIDLFEAWPKETQSLVARKLLDNIKFEYDDLQLVVELCEKIHYLAKQSTDETELAVRFTQKSFLRLVNTFKDLFSKTQEKLLKEKDMLEAVLKRLSNIEKQIPVLEEECKTLVPTIQRKREEIEKLENEIEVEREVETEAEISANGARSILSKAEKKLKLKKDEYDKRLKEINVVREIMIEGLQTLTTNEIAVLKTMKSPPKPIRLVAEALAYIKEIKPEKMQESGKIIDDFWKPTIKIICDTKFIESLIHFEMSDVSIRSLKLLEEKIINNDDFDDGKIRSYSAAAEAIYKWILVVYEFNQITKMDSDIRLQLNEVEEEFASAKSNLNVKEKHLEDIQTKRKNLLDSLDEGKAELDDLRKQETSCSKKKKRAIELTQILKKKNKVWMEKKQLMEEKRKTLTGDILLCSATLTYLTFLPREIREKRIEDWLCEINATGLGCHSNFNFANTLLDEFQIEKEKLSNYLEDDFFIDNLTIIRYSIYYPLIIDPQGIINAWIKDVEGANGLIVIRQDHDDYLRNLESAMSSGSPVLLENVGETIDPILYPLLEKQNFKVSGGGYQIKFGRNTVEFNADFRLYICTKMENPDFANDLYEKLTIVNCLLPKQSIENFLLKSLVKKEKPDLVTERNSLTAQLLDSRKILSESEWKIVTVLVDESDLLGNENIVNGISTSSLLVDDNTKTISEISNQLKAINESILEYRCNAEYFTNLYEILGELRSLNRLYQFSLKWFEYLITLVIDRADKIEKSEKRQRLLSDLFLKVFYSSVCHCFTKMDKLVFEYMLSIRSIKRKNSLVAEELNFFVEKLRNGSRKSHHKVDGSIRDFDKLNNFEEIKEGAALVEKFILETGTLPEPYETKFSTFQKLILKSCIRPKEIISFVGDFVKDELGIECVETHASGLLTAYTESNCCVPIAVVVFDNSDPLKQIFTFAIENCLTLEKCVVMTLTENEKNFQPEIFEVAKNVGSWVIIRDIQHTTKWLIELEKVFETLTPNSVHPDFRLWLILDADVVCPSFILQNSFLVSYSSSADKHYGSIKNELKNRLDSFDAIELPANIEEFVFKHLVSFHATLSESMNTLKWNVRHRLDDNDFQIVFHEICHFFNTHKEIPFAGLVSLICECCYGNRLADEWDLRCLQTLSRGYWNKDVIHFDQELSSVLRNELSNLPSSLRKLYEQLSELREEDEAIHFMSKLLSVQVESNQKENCSRRCSVVELDELEKITNSIPGQLEISSKSASMTDTFMDRFLEDELTRFNQTVGNARTKLTRLMESLKGYTYLTDESELLLRNLKWGLIPLDIVLSSESVSSTRFVKTDFFINEITARETTLKSISHCRAESVYDLSMLEFPRSLLVLNVLQHCMTNEISFHEFNIDVFVMQNIGEIEKSEFSIPLTGLVLKGASWDNVAATLEERELRSYSEMPNIHVTPLRNDTSGDENKNFVCPMYKTHAATDDEKRTFMAAVVLPTACHDDWINRRMQIKTKARDTNTAL